MAKTGDKIKGFFTGEKEEDDAEKIILQTEDGQNVKGYPCTPCIVGTWKDVYESEKIVRNHTDGTDEGDRLCADTEVLPGLCLWRVDRTYFVRSGRRIGEGLWQKEYKRKLNMPINNLSVPLPWKRSLIFRYGRSQGNMPEEIFDFCCQKMRQA